MIVSLVVAALAVARLTRLLVEDRVAVRWRQWVVKRYGPESMPSYLVHCPWCMSIYIAVPIMPIAVLLPHPWVIAVLAIPAASMTAGLLNDRGE